MNGLRAEFMRHVPSPDGPQSEVLFIEPNGEEHQVPCLCRPDGLTELGIFGGPERLIALENRYGTQVICALARQVTLAWS
ncbi:MAG TPA: hypothetical protein VEX38_08070 [Fimbriimonadaceae bacterium]|nr:hypothetical protein [Fimbriimonadaceae bacterium]